MLVSADVDIDDILEEVTTKDLVDELSSRSIKGHDVSGLNFGDLVDIIEAAGCPASTVSQLREWAERNRKKQYQTIEKWLEAAGARQEQQHQRQQ